jgi:hypothetical protein
MCYLGVGTTPLKRGVNPQQSACSRLGYVSSAVSGIHENPVESETAETANGVFADTADRIVLAVYSCGLAGIT